MAFETIKIENPKRLNMIMGQSHTLGTVEDIQHALVAGVPNIQFGLAFNKVTNPKSFRFAGTDDALVDLARRNASKIDAGDTFVLFLENAAPANVMQALKGVAKICKIYCATPNPVEVIIIENANGRGVMGLVGDYSA